MDKKITFETDDTKIVPYIPKMSILYKESVRISDVSKAKRVSDFLTEAYSDWIREGNPRTLGEFAKHLGISQSSLGHYMNQRQLPGDKAIDKIAAKLGSKIYDIMGKARPDPDLQYVITSWDNLTAQKQNEIRVTIEKSLANGDNRNH